MKTKRIVSYLISMLLVALLMINCANLDYVARASGLSQEYINQIPENAELIIVEKDVSADDLFDELYDILIIRGHRIDNHNNKTHYLTTVGKKVDDKGLMNAGLLQRMIVNVTDSDGTARLLIRTEWNIPISSFDSARTGVKMDEYDWKPATLKNVGREGVCFAESVLVAREINDSRISYK